MSAEIEFIGNDVAEAIAKACAHFNLPQNEITLKIVTTGHSGIFGLGRKQAKILASATQSSASQEPAANNRKATTKPAPKPTPKPAPKPAAKQESKQESKPATRQESPPAARQHSKPAARPAAPKPAPKQAPKPVNVDITDNGIGEEEEEESTFIITPEISSKLQNDLGELLKHMGFDHQVEILTTGNKLTANIVGENIEEVIGQEGQTLDAIQYLLRKMFNKQLTGKVIFTIDAGNFRDSRVKELQELALNMAQKVEEAGKTMTIPALNPSERRVVHLILQANKAIRSRSIGEGFYKKILIYPPGKGRKRPPRRRRNDSNQK